MCGESNNTKLVYGCVATGASQHGCGLSGLVGHVSLPLPSLEGYIESHHSCLLGHLEALKLHGLQWCGSFTASDQGDDQERAW
jgi:hypothetical protein